MRAWIFSDLHLTSADSPLFHSFLKKISESEGERDHLVFAGDIFDLLVGPSRYNEKKFLPFFELIRQKAQSGVKIHYTEGNHDFHLKALFPADANFQEEAVILVDQDRLPGKKLLYISHGDLIDSEDFGYLRLRHVLRSKPVEFLSHYVPGVLTEKLASPFSRTLEQKASARTSLRTREKFRQFAERKHNEGFDYIVLGHCHDFDAIPPYYFNMGYPPRDKQYLYYETGKSLGRREL